MLLKNRICILFLHYSNDDVTIKHYELLKKYNPTKNIYPIGFENHNLIDGSHIVCKKELYPKNNILNKTCKREYWSEADLLIYDFYLNYPNLPVYFIVEWDTYCNCSLENFYGNSLNMNHFSHIIHKEESLKSWGWYKLLSENQKLIPNIGGMTPTSGILFTKSVLSSMINLMINNPRQYDNMFSELRLGTLLQQSGYILNKPFLNSESYINWNYDSITFDPLKPGYYHPIKTIV
jgi:hypothetical protein